jgi:hypothetical protein
MQIRAHDFGPYSARIDALPVQRQADPCAPVELLELSFNDQAIASST